MTQLIIRGNDLVIQVDLFMEENLLAEIFLKINNLYWFFYIKLDYRLSL